jgi:hypothetical protein
MIIATKEEYEGVTNRLEKGKTAILEAGGFLKAPTKWVDAFQQMANASLVYEIENDLLTI